MAEKKGRAPFNLGLVLGVLQLLVLGFVFLNIKALNDHLVYLEKAIRNLRMTPVPATEVKSTLPLDEFLVNLLDAGRYVRVKITLGLALDETKKEDQAALAKIQKYMPVVRDTIIRVLSSKRSDEISTEEGKEALRKELIKFLNKALLPLIQREAVVDIWFEDFVIQ